MAARELTSKERAAIRKLVTSECANYDYEYGCLPLDYGRCYMLDMWWTGAYCKYFQNAVLPLAPALAVSLSGGAMETRPCAFCGGAFPVSGKQVYCSDVCADKARRKRQRAYMQKRRNC